MEVFVSADQRTVERPRSVLSKDESRPGLSGNIQIGHAIGKASGLADNRQTAVAHRLQLGQSRRLKAGGDRQDVRPRIDQPRQSEVEHQVQSDLLRKTLLQRPQAGNVFFIPAAHHNELGIEFGEKGGHGFQKNVEALLLGQPRDHPDHEMLLSLRKTELLLESSFVYDSTIYRMKIVWLGDERIGFGVVIFIVQTLCNSKQLLA